MDPRTADLLRLTLVPGLGPVRIARLIESLGSVDAVLSASSSALGRVSGIGPKTAGAIVEGRQSLDSEFEAEVSRIEQAGAHAVSIGSAGYPSLLSEVPSAPPVLFVRGSIEQGGADRYPVAIVGSRRCTAYGIEQAEHFGGALARAGLTVVSGGARGIDTAAHRGALRAGGRTIAVLGCGLGRCYPPENVELFDRIADGNGAVVSELPMESEPDQKNFPARNRLISGMSLGVVVIEAAKGSGALITARHAAEDHGREVMVVPGRVDSPTSEGGLGLIKRGEAHLVTSPGDVIGVLEQAGWHAERGTLGAFVPSGGHAPFENSNPRTGKDSMLDMASPAGVVFGVLSGAMSMDEVISTTGMPAGACAAAVTQLELCGKIRRNGSKIERCG